MANFTVMAGANCLSRPLANGRVESGYLQGGEVLSTNLTYDTETGEWSYQSYDMMVSCFLTPNLFSVTLECLNNQTMHLRQQQPPCFTDTCTDVCSVY